MEVFMIKSVNYNVYIEDNGSIPIYIEVPVNHMKRVAKGLFKCPVVSEIHHNCKNYDLHFKNCNLGSLEIKAKTWGHAIKAAHSIKLPFPEKLFNYVMKND